MSRYVLLAFAVSCSSVSTAVADEYLLRIDTTGNVGSSTTEEEPKETVVSSIEVIARPQAPFHGRVIVGTQQTLTLSGKLSPTDDGRFSLRVKYVHSINTGITVPTKDGKRKPLPDTTTIQTTTTVALGNPVTIAGSDTKTTQAGTTQDKSKRRYILLLTRYEASED